VNITRIDFDCVDVPKKCINYMEIKHRRDKIASGIIPTFPLTLIEPLFEEPASAARASAPS
jgi:hypothetical protein